MIRLLLGVNLRSCAGHVPEPRRVDESLNGDADGVYFISMIGFLVCTSVGQSSLLNLVLIWVDY